MAAKLVSCSITPEAVRAATVLHDLCEGWATSDRILVRARAAFPDWDLDSCYVKTIIVNNLYSTNVFATWRMAKHIAAIVETTELLRAEPAELVERVAALPKADGSGVEKHFRSFASKLCHFFVSEDRFPIYDSYAVWMLTALLRDSRASEAEGAYAAYIRNFDILRLSRGLDEFSIREIDRFLWVSGQYVNWKKKREAEINSELRVLFQSNSPAVVDAVQTIAACFKLSS